MSSRKRVENMGENMKKFEEIMVLIEGKDKSSDLKGTVQNTINQTDILLCIFKC